MTHILKAATAAKGKGKMVFSMMKVAEEAGISTIDLDYQLQILRRNKEATLTMKDKAAQIEILKAPSLTDLVPLAASLQAKMQVCRSHHPKLHSSSDPNLNERLMSTQNGSK